MSDPKKEKNKDSASYQSEQIKAAHLDGGNYFDNMQIDISESHRRFSRLPRNIQNIRKSKLKNRIKLFFTLTLMKLNLWEFLVVNGIIGGWFKDFKVYWSSILNGRPFWSTSEFFMLLHDYRKRQQHTSALDWNTANQHISNWQDPSEIFSTFHSVRKLAINRVVGLPLWKRVEKGSRILEYGCSLAPYYYFYRDYYSHLDATWILADIPSFPFHYAKFLYRQDKNVDFVTINAEDFSDPLHEETNFDVIIITTVLEHLNDPLYVTSYLLERLNPGGLLVFDYIKSEGLGLDHPKALEMREETIKYILDKTEIIFGKVDNINKSIGFCIARKKHK